MTRVLVIEDDAIIRSNILELLTEEGFEAVGATDGKNGIASALASVPDIIVCDIMMPVMDGHEVLRAVRDYPETAAVPFIFLTARAQREDVRAGMSLGADDYVTKPFTRVELLDSIRSRIDRASHLSALRARNGSAETPKLDAGPIVRSRALREVFDLAARAAQSNMNVLLLGETGVGKDVLAHAIHRASPRADKPFVPLNCAALAVSLLESELFGHEKGAFTGAATAQVGLFEAANGGSVFLDEVGDLPSTVQAKLLRAIEDGRVLRVGGRTFRDVNIRFIAATNRDLEVDVSAGTFRKDLFFRIAGIVLTVPPLRERREDIAPLAERFASIACQKLGREEPLSITEDAMRCLEAYGWPGNVRELRNVVERCVALSTGGPLTPDRLPEQIVSSTLPGAADPERASIEAQFQSYERRRIVDALDRCGGNQTRAADLLGISRRTLLNRLDELGLPRPRKK